MSGWYSWFILTLYLTDNLLLSMSFIAFMMSAGRIIDAGTEFLSGFIIDRTHTKIGKARPWILGTSFFVALPVFMVFNLLGQISQLVVGAYGVPILMYFGGSKRPSTPVKTQIKYVFSSKYSFPLFAMFLLFNFAAMIFNSIAVHFIRDVLGNALYGIGLAFYGSLLFASTADVADHINLTTKTDVSGLSTSISQLGMRVGMLLGSVGVSVILSLDKYDAQAANNGIA